MRVGEFPEEPALNNTMAPESFVWDTAVWPWEGKDDEDDGKSGICWIGCACDRRWYCWESIVMVWSRPVLDSPKIESWLGWITSLGLSRWLLRRSISTLWAWINWSFKPDIPISVKKHQQTWIQYNNTQAQSLYSSQSLTLAFFLSPLTRVTYRRPVGMHHLLAGNAPVTGCLTSEKYSVNGSVTKYSSVRSFSLPCVCAMICTPQRQRTTRIWCWAREPRFRGQTCLMSLSTKCALREDVLKWSYSVK